MGCLYQLTSPSGKSYIGITSKTLDERWKTHVMRTAEGRNQALQRAIRKYGADAFRRCVLVVADSWEYLCDLERKAIVAFETLSPDGYNLTAGGEGVVGRIHTPEAAARMSEGQRRRIRTPEELQRAADGVRRYWLSEAGMARKASAKAAKDAYKAGAKERHSLATRQAMARPEVKAKVQRCARERAANPEWRATMSNAKRGQLAGTTLPESTKLKMAETRRQWWAKRKQEEIS